MLKEYYEDSPNSNGPCVYCQDNSKRLILFSGQLTMNMCYDHYHKFVMGLATHYSKQSNEPLSDCIEYFLGGKK